ncbi:MAG: glycosyltransferase family 4 protein, partial [Alphaproteobacteria bacterium]|nr:glycosyltransferase family 4 protein [Alphaproteobacteria bacterium]
MRRSSRRSPTRCGGSSPAAVPWREPCIAVARQWRAVMKICQLCTVDFTLYHFLLPLMRGMREAGHEVVGVCADGPLLADVRRDGFRVETAPLVRGLDPLANARALAALVRLLSREHFDLVHVHTPVAAALGRLAARLAGAPRIVYTAHGFFFHERMAATPRAACIVAEWIAGRLTHALFTQSEEDARTARRLGLCRSGDVLAIGNGSDPARFAPDPTGTVRARVRGELGTPANRVVIMMVGRLVAEKGYPELFAAIRDVDAELWCIGARLDSDHAASVDRAFADATADPACAARIRLLGYRADVPDLLRAADIFTLPSHREGMPRSIVEAMLAGLPVVATNVRGSREEVVPGETGLLVPVADRAALAA